MMFLNSYLNPLFLTLALELPLVLLILFKFDKRSILIVLTTNIITNLTLNIIVDNYHGRNVTDLILIGEFIILGVEAIVYYIFFYPHVIRVPLAAFLANLASYVLGTILPQIKNYQSLLGAVTEMFVYLIFIALVIVLSLLLDKHLKEKRRPMEERAN